MTKKLPQNLKGKQQLDVLHTILKSQQKYKKVAKDARFMVKLLKRMREKISSGEPNVLCSKYESVGRIGTSYELVSNHIQDSNETRLNVKFNSDDETSDSSCSPSCSSSDDDRKIGFSQKQLADELVDLSPNKDVGLKLVKVIGVYLSRRVLPSKPALLKAIVLWVNREKTRKYC
ncbi:4987_t:CDS:2 [Ambispora gerdemannii]|uniref:4987_t:CDS:1 n=1 Tax=Ambispora gerdemannii TaxID=144530 RepID=A0A9N8V4Z3_9GLOM|nr:4987_t:CDS:2 [Ambispora gerdemannii]